MESPEIQLMELTRIDSTNTFAKTHFRELADGTLITAEEQTAGRGRLGRSWVSPAGVNLCATLVMKQIANPFYATIAASLAVLKLLRSALPEKFFYIKWPNDIYAEGCKICGMLCETSFRGNRVEGVVAGMGININLEQKEIDLIGQNAVSLKTLSGRSFDVKELTRMLMKFLSEEYGCYLKEPEKLFEEWKKENFVIGKTVRLSDASGGNFQSCIVRDIAPSGELIVEENGQLRRYSCGDVTLDKKSLPVYKTVNIKTKGEI